MTPRSRFAALLGVALGLSGAIGVNVTACSQAPTPTPVRTFERAEKMDVVCLRLYEPDPARPGFLVASRPVPLPQEECAPVPPGANGEFLQNQLFALVTQTTRGELAVVDLSAGRLVDQTRATPGINFVPVGAQPTDVAAAPDGKMVFVSAAEPNKAAIYGVPSTRLLGDTPGFPPDPDGPLTLASLPACALPQNPVAMAIVPRRTAAPIQLDAGAPPDAGEAGAPDAATPAPAADAGVAESGQEYDIAVILGGDRRASAKLLLLDPAPFLRGARVQTDPGPSIAPGALPACQEVMAVRSAIELSGSAALPATFRRGEAWEDGIAYDDAGVDLRCRRPDPALSCGLPPCCDTTAPAPVPTDAGATDAGADAAPVPAARACTPLAEAGAPPADIPLDLGPLDPPRAVAIARDGQTLYVSDDAISIVHVVDATNPNAPVERAPLLATSLLEPGRPVSVRGLAVGPTTRDYKKYLYAIDKKDGSLMVYDITRPSDQPRSPLVLPYPELNPFQPPDRLAFVSPVVAVTFARHDFPLTQVANVPLASAPSGLLCNPSPAAGVGQGPFTVPGAYYRAGLTDIPVNLGPSRLRGIFAFAALANGQVVTIDVDDWDAPCRRPKDLGGEEQLAPAPTAGPDPLDPIRLPTGADGVTDEAFFPVSAPHRMRSAFLLKDDPAGGNHAPFLLAQPQIASASAPLAISGPGSESTPRLRPTALKSAAPTTQDVGVRFSLDVPDVHIDQDWTVSWEGQLPRFDGIAASISTTDAYQTLTLSQPQGQFCSRGVEDWRVGSERAVAIQDELARRGQPDLPRLDHRMVDYVQITDEVLGPDDPWWLENGADGCWDPSLAPGPARQRACQDTYGPAAEESPQRDFPVLESYDDHLVVGRFFGPVGSREVVPRDPSNAGALKLMRCCFHNQVRFRVRTASQWVAVGSQVGYLSHLVRAADGRCVQSCDPREALLNARAPSLRKPPQGDFAPHRDSPLAMRNPMFSFFVMNGVTNGADEPPARGHVYRFSSRGQFVPVTITIGGSSIAVNPQSMRFIDSLGQIALVDAASQGLVLIDLKSVAIARAPFF